MNQKEVEQYLIDFQKRDFPKLIERSLRVSSSKKINVIFGPRRAGKTYYLFQVMQQLIKSGMQKEEVVYLNFESPRLFDIGFKEIREVITLHRRLFPKTNRPTLFFDEPQNINFWERSVRELYDEGYRIFLSGSSSKLLGKEIATSLRGRSLSYLLLPFSFKEFLRLKKVALAKRISSNEKAKILALLDEYLEFGGFPEVVLEDNKETKLRILDDYLSLTVYKDIVERYKIRDTVLIKWFIKSLISSYTKEVSINKLYLTLKSQNRKVSKDELYDYASMCNDILFTFYLPKFSWSLRKREPVSKVYLGDTGFSKLIETTKDVGKRMENTVFLELIRRLTPLQELYFWKNVQREEVDFVVKEGGKISQLIQVCSDVDDFKTKKREIRALLKASKELRCNNLLIITDNLETEEVAEWYGTKGRVRFIPLWRWLVGWF